jgi:hypothetical protein
MISLASLFSGVTVGGMVWVLAMIVFHELGHYIVAKRQGIYKSVGIIPFLGPVVNMTTYLKSRWDYLAGIAFSMLAFPIFYLIDKPGANWWVYPFLAIGLGILDIVTCIFYTPITKAIDKQTGGG